MQYSQGFNLVELVIVLAITAVLAVMAIPTARSYVSNQRNTTIASALSNALNLARNEAIRRGTSVQVCPSNGATPPVCSQKAADWIKGWLVRCDNCLWDPNNNLYVSDIIQVYSPIIKSALTTCATRVTFTSIGIANVTLQTGTGCPTMAFSIKSPKCSQGKTVTVLPIGKIVTGSVTCP